MAAQKRPVVTFTGRLTRRDQADIPPSLGEWVGCAGSFDADTPARLVELLAEETVRDEERLGRRSR